MTENPEIIKKRIEALSLTAQINAQRHSGDAATAAADLLCAFVLISIRSGASPEAARDAMWEHAIAACADFFGTDGRRADA